MLPEAQAYSDRLRDRRKEILKCVQGLDAAGLEWKPRMPDTNSLAVLAFHSLGAERNWLHAVVGQKAIERNREAEFRVRAKDVISLPAMYAAVAEESEQILAALAPEELNAVRAYRNRDLTVRWCILHVLEHYSEHLGQMWLTRQLYENSRD